MDDEKSAVVAKRTASSPYNVLISRRTWIIARMLIVFLLILLVVLSAALTAIIIIKVAPPYCSKGLTHSGRNLDKPGLFNDMTPGEMIAVRDYLLSEEKIGLTPFEEATVNSSYIFMMTLHVPFKAGVLKYLKGEDRKPKRTANVIVYRGNTQPPKIEEYLVGPLPKPSYHRVITNPAYRRVPIPFSSRPVDIIERQEFKKFLETATKDMEVLFKDSYNLKYKNCTKHKDCIIFKDFAPRGIKSGERKSWFWAYRATDGFHLHPLGFAIQINHENPDSNKWSVLRIIYNGQLFYEIEDLMERYNGGTLRKIESILDDTDAEFSTFTRRGHHSFDSRMRGPRLLEPDGHRYSVDDQFVKYFGWSFNFHMHTAKGLGIIDVYFQGERVAYELSLQEINAFYTGYSPETSWLALYGVSWLLGASSYELMPGVDCPATATFHDSYHFVNSGTPVRNKNSICIFEQTLGIPLRRHYSFDKNGEFNSYGGLVSSSLVVRTIISLWSCDYILDYIFHLDGSIELKLSVTGYIQASYELAGQRPYGNRVHNKLRGNLHQHLFHWKIDLDIESTDNRYQTLDFGTETSSSFWYEGAINKTQLKMTPSLKENEKQGNVPYNFDRPQHHIVYNHDAENKFGTFRAYRIINDNKSKFLLHDSAITKAAPWTKYQMVVTKYKDIESVSSSIYAQGDPFDPVLDFSRFLEDNDTIVDTDLVIWVTSGLYAVPHAEDVPSMSTVANECRVILKPYNFFNHCPSMAVSDAVRVTRGMESKGLNFETFGTSSSEPQCYQKEKSIKEFHGENYSKN